MIYNLRVQMRITLIGRLLFLQEQVHVLLLQNKRQMEIRDVKRQFLRVKHAEHVHLLSNLLNTALELADALLLARMLPDHMFKDLLADADLLTEVDLLERSRKKEVLRNRQLLL